MPNGRTKRQPSRTKTSRRAARPPQRRRVPRNPSPSLPVSSVCGLTDPFCAHARGAKYPDPSSTRTLAYTFNGRVDVPTDGAGSANWLWYPQYGFSPLTDAAARTGDTVTAWTNFAASTSIASAVSYRIVSAGFIVRATCAPLSCSGSVLLRSYSQLTPATLTSVNPKLYNCSSFKDVSLNKSYEGVVSIHQHNTLNPVNFYSCSASTAAVASAPSNGFTPQCITIAGGPASAVACVIDYVIHYEITFADDDGLSQATTNSPPANLFLTAAAARVTSTIPTFFERGARLAGEYILRSAAAALGARLGGSQGALMGRQAANAMLAVDVD